MQAAERQSLTYSDWRKYDWKKYEICSKKKASLYENWIKIESVFHEKSFVNSETIKQIDWAKANKQRQSESWKMIQ